jgi:uncharacterized protein YukE
MITFCEVEPPVKFDMGAETLTTLTRQTQGSSDDLGTLIKQLIAAVTPLETTFQGTGRAQFDAFKANADQITADLNSALAAIIGGQSGMNTSFVSGDTEMADNAAGAAGSANFDAARFGARA